MWTELTYFYTSNLWIKCDFKFCDRKDLKNVHKLTHKIRIKTIKNWKESAPFNENLKPEVHCIIFRPSIWITE